LVSFPFTHNKNSQFHSIENSENPFAKYIAEDDYYPEFIQTAIDILHRLKKNKEIIKYFLNVGKVKKRVICELYLLFER